MKKLCLVTGGAGFIGSHLCKKLLDLNYEVICLDNLITGSIDNILDIINDKNFIFIDFNICKEIKINHNVDYIFHFASLASPIDYVKLPIETLHVGSIGTQNVIDFAMKNNSKLIFSSTSEVYGDPLVHPQIESYWGNVNPIGVRSVYDESKRFSEALLMGYKRKFNLDIGLIRIFNTYGPNMRYNDGRVIPNFVCQALKNKDITVYGDGSQTRSFCYIDDLINGIIKFHLLDEVGPINLGNNNEISILEVATKIKEILSSSSNIVFKDLPHDDPKTRCPVLKKAKEILDWKPVVSFDDGLLSTINYFKTIKDLN